MGPIGKHYNFKSMKASLFSLFCSLSLAAQTKGVVTDYVSGEPIAFASIWSENQNIGTTSEENGHFTIHTDQNSKRLIFSAIGFEKKIVDISQAKDVRLQPVDYQLDEVVISKSKGTRQIEIGKTANTICQAFDNGPRIDVKYFPYQAAYRKTRYLKKVSLYTDSRIENATVRLHFYSVDANGFPGAELLNRDLIVTVRKGTATNVYDLSDYHLKMPETGLFVGFEKLIVEKNKLEKTTTDPLTQKTSIRATYYPFVLYNRVERPFLYTNSGGKWTRKTGEQAGGTTDNLRIYEPAINLVLSN